MNLDYKNTGHIPTTDEATNPAHGFPDKESNEYFYQRWVFDISYWIIMIIIVMGIIGGLIIDTFADLRVKRNEN